MPQRPSRRKDWQYAETNSNNPDPLGLGGLLQIVLLLHLGGRTFRCLVSAAEEMPRLPNSPSRYRAIIRRSWHANDPHHQRLPGEPQRASGIFPIAKSISPTFPNQRIKNSNAPAASDAPQPAMPNISSRFASPREYWKNYAVSLPNKTNRTKRISMNSSSAPPASRSLASGFSFLCLCSGEFSSPSFFFLPSPSFPVHSAAFPLHGGSNNFTGAATLSHSRTNDPENAHSSARFTNPARTGFINTYQAAESIDSPLRKT